MTIIWLCKSEVISLPDRSVHNSDVFPGHVANLLCQRRHMNWGQDYVDFGVNNDVSVIKNCLTGIVFKTKQNLMGKVMKG